jgi:hypothetical protein
MAAWTVIDDERDKAPGSEGDLYLMHDGEAAAQANDPTRRLPGAGWVAVAGVAARAHAARVRR